MTAQLVGLELAASDAGVALGIGLAAVPRHRLRDRLLTAAGLRAALAKTLREARVKNARAVAAWTEILATDLVQRQHWQVHVTSDDALVPHPGIVYEPGTAAVLADRAPLRFYVDDGGDLVFLEPTGKTWSEIYLRQAEREIRAREPTHVPAARTSDEDQPDVRRARRNGA